MMCWCFNEIRSIARDVFMLLYLPVNQFHRARPIEISLKIWLVPKPFRDYYRKIGVDIIQLEPNELTQYIIVKMKIILLTGVTQRYDFIKLSGVFSFPVIN